MSDTKTVLSIIVAVCAVALIVAAAIVCTTETPTYDEKEWFAVSVETVYSNGETSDDLNNTVDLTILKINDGIFNGYYTDRSTGETTDVIGKIDGERVQFLIRNVEEQTRYEFTGQFWSDDVLQMMIIYIDDIHDESYAQKVWLTRNGASAPGASELYIPDVEGMTFDLDGTMIEKADLTKGQENSYDASANVTEQYGSCLILSMQNDLETYISTAVLLYSKTATDVSDGIIGSSFENYAYTTGHIAVDTSANGIGILETCEYMGTAYAISEICNISDDVADLKDTYWVMSECKALHTDGTEETFATNFEIEIDNQCGHILSGNMYIEDNEFIWTGIAFTTDDGKTIITLKSYDGEKNYYNTMILEVSSDLKTMEMFKPNGSSKIALAGTFDRVAEAGVWTAVSEKWLYSDGTYEVVETPDWTIDINSIRDGFMCATDTYSYNGGPIRINPLLGHMGEDSFVTEFTSGTKYVLMKGMFWSDDVMILSLINYTDGDLNYVGSMVFTRNGADAPDLDIENYEGLKFNDTDGYILNGDEASQFSADITVEKQYGPLLYMLYEYEGGNSYVIASLEYQKSSGDTSTGCAMYQLDVGSDTYFGNGDILISPTKLTYRLNYCCEADIATSVEYYNVSPATIDIDDTTWSSSSVSAMFEDGSMEKFELNISIEILEQSHDCVSGIFTIDDKSYAFTGYLDGYRLHFCIFNEETSEYGYFFMQFDDDLDSCECVSSTIDGSVESFTMEKKSA